MSFKTGQVENIKFPWFKERLKTKYLRDLGKKQQLSGALDSRKWRFLSPGLDDFRDGFPTVNNELFTQSTCGPSPAVFGMPNHSCSVKFPQKRLSKTQACYSKQNPQSQAQREFIDAVEHKLKQHPLALYPHLESGMTPELFDQVLSVLDPDMCMKEELSITSPKKKMEHLEENTAQCESSTPDIIKSSITIKPQRENCKDARPRNPYKWQKLKATLSVKEDQMLSVKHLHSVSQEDDKQMITKLFCEWITSLGGETTDLTELTILDLFKSEYEKKTLVTLPFNKIEPNRTIAKLNSSVVGSHENQCVKELTQAQKPNRPQAANDPLVLAEITGSLDFEEQLSEQDNDLKQIHGLQAFREFIIKKGVRMPRFLSAVFSKDEQKNRIRGSTSSSSSTGRAVH